MATVYEGSIHADESGLVEPLTVRYFGDADEAEAWVREQLRADLMAVMGEVVELERSEITGEDLASLLNSGDVQQWSKRLVRATFKTVLVERTIVDASSVAPVSDTQSAEQ